MLFGKCYEKCDVPTDGRTDGGQQQNTKSLSACHELLVTQEVPIHLNMKEKFYIKK